MRESAGALSVVVAVGAFLTSAAALAENPLGAYVGVGVGESTVRSDNNFAYAPYGGYGCSGFYDYCGDDYSHHFGWKVAAGIRPISLVGAELEYIDFGHPGGDQSYDYYDNNFGPDSHPRAIAAFGVGHVPLPLPFLDVYGKLGVARLHTDVNGFDGCPLQVSCTGYIPESRWDTRFAYGLGLQTTFRALGVRAEYERISSPYGDPDLFSVGLTWTF